MRVAFIASDKPRERILAEAFLDGAKRHGNETRMVDRADAVAVPDCDVVAMVGVKSRELFEVNKRAGIRIVYLDKGYVRQRAEGRRAWEFWRVAVDDHQPTRILGAIDYPDDRWRALEIEPRPWRATGEHIVFAGSSEKYHAFYGLDHPTQYAVRLVRKIRRLKLGRIVVYRPKPSWQGAVPIPRARYSPPERRIDDELAGAHALVTHGSNACFEAMLAGVPSVIVGNAIARPISSTDLHDLAAPKLATDSERARLLANLAYCQWTLAEFGSGAAWETIKGQIYA